MTTTLGRLSASALRAENRYLKLPREQRACARLAYFDVLYAAAELDRSLAALRAAMSATHPATTDEHVA